MNRDDITQGAIYRPVYGGGRGPDSHFTFDHWWGTMACGRDPKGRERSVFQDTFLDNFEPVPPMVRVITGEVRIAQPGEKVWRWSAGDYEYAVFDISDQGRSVTPMLVITSDTMQEAPIA